MSERRTDDERDVTDAIIRIKRLKTRATRLDIVEGLIARGLCDRNVLFALAHTEFMAGFCDGVDEANGTGKYADE